MTDKEKQIRHHAEQIISLLDESEETYLRNFQAEIVSNRRVNVTWESNQEGLFDIEYYRPNQDREWQHSVAKYREPIQVEAGEVSIGFNSDVTEVKFRAVLGGEVVEEFSVKTEEKEPENPKPPTKPDIPLINQDTKWENHGIVIPTGRFAGRDYRIAGVFRRNDEIGVVYQSKHSQAHTALTAGSVAISKDLVNWRSAPNNPVLRQAMSWQGVDGQGRAYRTGAATVVDIDNTLYCYYRDREGRGYTSFNHGMRAMGVAHSKNGVNWTQMDYPFLTVADVARMIPSKYFLVDPVFRQGRVYLNYASYDPESGYIYAILAVLYDGKPRPVGSYQRYIIRGKDPLRIDNWEFVDTPWMWTKSNRGREPQFFWKVGNKWMVCSNVTQSGVRYTGIQYNDRLEDRYTPEILIPNGFRSNPRSLEIFHWDGKWNILLSDRNSPDNIHLIQQK